MGYFSNGTDLAFYQEQYCSRCVHLPSPHAIYWGCPVMDAHRAYSYELCNETTPGKRILDMLIPMDGVNNGPCAMFVERPEIKERENDV